MKEKIMNGLLNVAGKIQTQRHMASIKNGFTAMLPIIITGSFCTLFMNVVCSTTTAGLSLAKIPGMSWLGRLMPMFEAANYATMNFMAIGIVIAIALEMGKRFERTEFTLPIVALACYVSLCNNFTTVKFGDKLETIANVLPREFTNAQGLFLGMLTALAASEIYCRIYNSGKLEIKMPDTVPPNVTKAFNSLFPAMLTILIVSGMGMVFKGITNMTIAEAVSSFIQKPLQGVLTGLPGYLLLIFMTTLLWSFGIHGTQVLKPIYEPIMLAAIAENMEAVLAGETAPHILNSGFLSTFSTGTGAGITGGLLIAIFLFSKREDYRAVAKIALPCGLFNINEPLMFGLPIVLNPILAIPFMIAPAVSATFAYFMTKIGVATVMTVYAPFTTPPLLKSFINSGGHLGTVFVELCCILISACIYTPFILLANKQAAMEQNT